MFLDVIASQIVPFLRHSVCCFRNRRQYSIIVLFHHESYILTGIGYRLYIVKNHSCIPENVFHAIKVHVPGVRLDSNVGAELSFVLPKEQSANFEKLFTDLEFNQNSLGINSFGVSVTTLEEVFLK